MRSLARNSSSDFADPGYIMPPSDIEYRKAAIVMAAWAKQEGVLDELPELLDMIGFPR